jgi:hypothetical protein
MTDDATRWQRKADALIRLAEDQRGKPEGDLARQKLLDIINAHPEAFEYQPLLDFAHRELTLRDVGEMERRGISTEGSWTAPTLEGAVKLMVADYKRRLWGGQAKRLENELHEIDERVKRIEFGLDPVLLE